MFKVAPLLTCILPVNLYVFDASKVTSPSAIVPWKLLGSTTKVEDGLSFSLLSLEQLVKKEAVIAKIPNNCKKFF